MKWMGILSEDKATVTGNNLLEILCTQLSSLMSYNPGERDLVMLQHKFVVEWQDGNTVRYLHSQDTTIHAKIQPQETFTSTLELLGNPNG
jgi:hypothetical protein